MRIYISLCIAIVVAFSFACSSSPEDPDAGFDDAGNDTESDVIEDGEQDADTDVSGDAGRDADVGAPGDDVGTDTGDDVGSDAGDSDIITASYDFRDGQQSWQHGYSNFSPGMEDIIEFEAQLQESPEELEREGTGYYFSAHNRSDDLFMFLKRRLGAEEGINPNQSYMLEYEILFASNTPSNCFGIGGAPGESVWLKAGGATIEPEVIEENDYYVMNVDIGNQSVGGEAAAVTGDVANGIPCDEVDDLEDAPYVAIERTYSHEFAVEADESGELWLLVGTDSGFEGLNTLYYLEIDVELHPL